METLDQLGIALGLAAMAGVNVYLTTFLVGLAVRIGWVDLVGTSVQQLEVLANPWVLGISGVMMVIEFVADKIPVVDSVWDGIHAVIRPLGGMALAWAALADLPPALLAISALVAGSASLATHGTKSGMRLLVNASPEPVSNSVASVAEDGLVIGGLAMLVVAPAIAFFVFLVICIGCAALTLAIWRRVFRRGRSKRHLKSGSVVPDSL